MLRRLALVAGAFSLLTLTACSSTVALEPAKDANNPLCAEVTVRLPDAVSGEDRRWTDAQATGAYGDPASVFVSCGVTVPGPTSELQCITLEGIDWLVDESQAPMMRMTTYGRNPAVQVFVDTEVVSANDALSNAGIVSGVRMIPATSACTEPNELPE
ncbi:DUF3515 family protein [Microbacterium esteraromaticum]|uniref:DUF3515 family protein n=1 Tax=Microbacterium esteraromaticum TaxID=57043 RepID=A0A939DX29_9MICO|nr:DUF3515 family protein [Microbacterium esteraromaticum]MBN8205984.1 DUF3515 family protein [Microbacterium esteraromaticum]MBN8416139.1 DUF3515 family protein [Microbacterium esteraromaticum]MBY6060958.1 DUF3515 domain-containing protein [Microbacterium esteraromaticum]